MAMVPGMAGRSERRTLGDHEDPRLAKLAFNAGNLTALDLLNAGSGQWQVRTVKRGWATLAPALQAALTQAMSQIEDRVEILIDPDTRTWVRDVHHVDAATRARCQVYEAFPIDRKMGKVGGEAPRALRWRAGAEPIKSH